MKKRWPLIVGCVFARLVQIAALVGAYELHVLSTEKMGVMRWLVAKNLMLEQGWFSWEGLIWQATAFLVLAGTLTSSAVLLTRRPARFATLQTMIAVLIAGAGAWLASEYTTADSKALYFGIIAVWLVLAVQLVVTQVATGIAWRKSGIEFMPRLKREPKL